MKISPIHKGGESEFLKTVNFNNKYISNKPRECRNTHYWVDDTPGTNSSERMIPPGTNSSECMIPPGTNSSECMLPPGTNSSECMLPPETNSSERMLPLGTNSPIAIDPVILIKRHPSLKGKCIYIL